MAEYFPPGMFPPGMFPPGYFPGEGEAESAVRTGRILISVVPVPSMKFKALNRESAALVVDTGATVIA